MTTKTRREKLKSLRAWRGDLAQIDRLLDQLGSAAAAHTARRYRETFGHAAPTIGSTKVRPRHQKVYDEILAAEVELRRPEVERLTRKRARLVGLIERHSCS